MITPRFFFYLSLLLFVFVLGIIKSGKLSNNYKTIVFLVGIVFISELVTKILAWNIRSSMPAYHFLVVLQGICYWFFYRFGLRDRRIAILYSIVILTCICNSIFFQELTEFPNNSVILLSFAVIISSLFHLRKMIQKPNEKKLYKSADFWFNTSSIFFYSTTFFCFGLMNIGLDLLPSWIYDFIFIANIILYSCYGVSIYLNSLSYSK